MSELESLRTGCSHMRTPPPNPADISEVVKRQFGPKTETGCGGTDWSGAGVAVVLRHARTSENIRSINAEICSNRTDSALSCTSAVIPRRLLRVYTFHFTRLLKL